ncbi:hypothetical protein [Dietzia sp. UCD-THP]|uniref:hypothetical protein n=1 Tax=Dietzia sp. UCD-THP TaxID=1292020 RepID=UPI001267D728|nr:hypothetical protein [Dietzia sp. UCD-THP]
MSWHSTDGIALEVYKRHGLPHGVCRRLVELEFRKLQDSGAAVVRSHLLERDRAAFLAAIAEAVSEV